MIDEAKKGEERRIGEGGHKGMREANEDRRIVFQYSPQRDP